MAGHVSIPSDRGFCNDKSEGCTFEQLLKFQSPLIGASVMTHLLGVCGFVCENQDSPYMHWLVGSVDKRPLRIETILRLHKEALGKLERGELENREDNNNMFQSTPPRGGRQQ